MKVTTVVLNYNGWEDTEKCLARITSSPCADSEILLVDNGSSEDRTPEIHLRYPHIGILRNLKNKGYAGGNNDGIRQALSQGAELIFLLNNDTLVAPETIDVLKTAFERNPQFGIIGPIINYMDEPETVMADGCLFNLPGRPGFFTRKPVENSGSALHVEPCDIVNGCAIAIRRTVFERIGLLDESLFIVHEESDFCLRARKVGISCGILNKVLIWHKGSSSFRREGKEHQRYFDSRNLLPLICKFGSANGRSHSESLAAYLKYVYYRYCHELESGNQSAALACAEGLADAIRRRTGPRMPRRNQGVVRGISAFFNCIRRFRSRTYASV
jgi:GT2 family glycosyltransferase